MHSNDPAPCGNNEQKINFEKELVRQLAELDRIGAIEIFFSLKQYRPKNQQDGILSLNF